MLFANNVCLCAVCVCISPKLTSTNLGGIRCAVPVYQCVVIVRVSVCWRSASFPLSLWPGGRCSPAKTFRSLRPSTDDARGGVNQFTMQGPLRVIQKFIDDDLQKTGVINYVTYKTMMHSPCADTIKQRIDEKDTHRRRPLFQNRLPSIIEFTAIR